MEQVAIHQVGTLALWVGFAIGLLLRWADRAHYVVSQTPERTWLGYLEHNWGRLIIRLGGTCYAFYLLLGQGAVTTEVIAFSTGVSADTLTESFIDRAKQQGEKRWAGLRAKL